MGVYAVRHLRSILTFLTDVLSAPFATAYLPLLSGAARAVEVVIRVCWVRLGAGEYSVMIVRGVVVAWLRIVEEEGGSVEVEEIEKLKDVLKGCVRDLHVVMQQAGEEGGRGDSIIDIATKVVERDERCKGLFEGIIRKPYI